MGFLVTDDLFVKNMGVMYNGGYAPGSGGISPNKAYTVACRQTNEALPMNMDGYHIDDSNLIQMMSIDGDKLELGKVEIKIENAAIFTEENYRITEEIAALEKKYGVHGPIFIDRTTEYMDETYGQLNYANIDQMVFSAHAKADGVKDDKVTMLFNTDLLAAKIYTFFSAPGTSMGDLRRYDQKNANDIESPVLELSQEDLDAIEQLKSQMDNIFNELVSNIQNGKGDSVQALEGKLSIKGFELTLGEVMDIRDGFNNVNYMCSGTVDGYFRGFEGTDAVSGLAKSYFETYANEYLSEDAATLAKQTYDKCLSAAIKSEDRSMADAPVKPGTEYYHPNAIFTGTFKEDLFNILANIDTSSEAAWKSGIPDAIDKAMDFKFEIHKRCGVWDELANRYIDSSRMWINQALSRMKSMDQIRTVF